MKGIRRRPRKNARWSLATSWRALLACVLSVLVGGAPLAIALHRAFTPHVVCEHGDLIESAEGESALTGAQQKHIEKDSKSAAEINAADPVSHAHGHCSFGVVARDTNAIARPALPFCGCIEREDAAFHACETVRAFPLLLNAPKTSPPRIVRSA